MWNRIVAVLAGIVVVAAIEAFLIGVLAYFLVRYIGYGIRERRRMNAETEAAMLAMMQRLKFKLRPYLLSTRPR